MAKHRVLYYDLETAPALVLAWRAKTHYISYDHLVRDVFIITWAAKWRDSKKVMSNCCTKNEVLGGDDSRVLLELSILINQADATVAHNGDQFDNKTVNARLAINGLPPVHPTQSIDTLKMSRKTFGMWSHALDHLGKSFVGHRKIKTDFDLWKRVIAGEKKAMAEMVRYNKQDVLLLQEVHEYILPYIRNNARLVDAGHAGQIVCPSCGEGQLTKRGFTHAKVGVYQRYQCQACGLYSRAAKMDPDKSLGTRLV